MEQVVTLTEINEHIIQVKMHDREARNTFSPALKEGIINAFETIKQHPSYKVVILTGYDNYFCCGGTKEELFSIYRKETGFNDLNFFTLPMDCEIPVIAAMQGHALGGGFVLGCYSDFVILGKENIYTTNFMKYGFTPGMGATYVVPQKMGLNLGNEMLFSADNFRGEVLKQRGVQQKVVPKKEVLNEAIKMAESLAEKPRLSLITLKNHLCRKSRIDVRATIKQELEMHEITFHQPLVKERITTLFNH